jgi:hypothetical protein
MFRRVTTSSEATTIMMAVAMKMICSGVMKASP